MKDYEMLIDFVRRCCVYHPDETPEWYHLEIDSLEMDPDDIHDCFRDDYGADTDCGVVRDVCEEARKIMEHLEVK